MTQKTVGHKKAPSVAALGASDNAIDLEVNYIVDITKPPMDAQARSPGYSTPEDVFRPTPINSLDQIEDALTCALHRCKAQVYLMFVASENGELSGNDLSHSIWLLEGQLEQMHQMIRGRAAGRVLQ